MVTLAVDDVSFDGFFFPESYPQRTLAGGVIMLDMSAYGLYPYDAATIRVYTRNDADDPSLLHLGMTGTLDRDKTVPLRIHTPNFGNGIDADGDGIPDIDNDSNWRDNHAAVWVTVSDENAPVPETWCTSCHPMIHLLIRSVHGVCRFQPGRSPQME